MAAHARQRVAEQLAEVGIRAPLAPSAALLQETVDQFERVIDLEQSLLRKSILKLEQDLEETGTEVGMKEEELMVWEERLQQIQQDNEVKLRLAKVRIDSARWRHKSESRHAASARRASPLGLIAEGNEDSSGDEQVEEDGEEEEEEEAGDASPREEGGACGGAARAAPQHLATVEAINTLAGMVVDELAILRMQWRELITSTKAAAAGEQMQHDAEERADRSERGAVSRQKQASQAEQWFRLDDGQQQLLTCRMSAAAPEQAPRAAAALPTTVPGDGTVAPLPPRLSAPAATLRGPVTGPPWHGAVPQGGAPPGGPPPGAAPRVQAPQMGTLQGARPPAPWHASRPGAVAAAAPGQSRLYQSPAWARVPTWSPNAC